ncbi:MAG: BamA/TamA family outer membrane protein [Ignavibacteriales bacterium]|nr:BamA/TamA family outer membrane protein [Ignavibacteriales bacterium]
MKKFIFFCCITTFLHSQHDTTKFVTMIPGEHYAAGSLHRFFLGDHWRDLWGVPIQVEVLDLEHFAGGLTPTERGGGFQTKSLRLRGTDGKEYKFRSLDKDPTRILPDDLQETFVEDIIQDQISWSHPYSAIIATSFVEAVGVLQAPPKLVVLPNSDHLGEFQSDFGGLLGTLEENPDDKDGIVFANADKIKSTYSLFKELDDDNDEMVDQKEFLKARLVDIFLGDWDRHVDQWKWAGYKVDGKRIWKPIPRDRDQALAKIDGAFLWGVTWAVKQIESYETVYPDIQDMTWSGRHLDRKFLNRLTKSEWDSVTHFIVNVLTDSLISFAVHQMPQQMYDLEGKNIESKLRERRDYLFDASEEFYRLCAKFVDVRMSSKNEYAEVHRLNDSLVDVMIWKRDKERGEKKREPLYSRRFLVDETKEIRLDLLDGDDYAEITGDVDQSIEIHIDGGEGKDKIIDNSIVRGWTLSVVPIPSAETKTIIYDSGKKSDLKTGASSCVINHKFEKPDNDTAVYEPVRDYGDDFRPLGVAAYNSADGVVIGGGQTLFGYDVKYDPFHYKMDLSAAYATGHNAFRVDYQAIFKTYDKDLSYLLDVRLSGIEVLRFYGIGNEVTLPVSLEKEKYYTVKQGQYIFHPQVQYKFVRFISFNGGVFLKHSDILLRDSSYVKLVQPYGASNMTIGSLHAGIKFDSRDHDLFPTSGVYSRSEVYFYPKAMSDKFNFTKARLDLRWYIPTAFFSQTIFAFRAFGEKIFGTYPFYEASYLGGTESVRGFEKQRFSGDASMSFHAESRFHLGKIKLLLPFHVGGMLFGETGRVFATGEKSDLWHAGFGAGIWSYIVDKDVTFSISIAQSREEIEGHFTTGFSF